MSKPRPPNAAGPNGLRGGIKTYNPKTITGPWLEEIGGPSGFQRGFTSPDYETESQHQQLGAFKQKFPDFGNELPDDRILKRPTSPFKYEGPKATDPWTSNTKLMGLSSTLRKNPDEENTVYTTMLKPSIPIPQLENYRETWTHENNQQVRNIRWTTETQRSLNSGILNKKFTATTIRFLPGTPKSYEKFRETLIEKYGILSFIILKFEFFQFTRNNDYNNHNTNEVSILDFRVVMNRLGLGLKPHEVNQLVAYVTPSSTTVPVDKFIYTVKGNMNSFNKISASDIFTKILSKYSANDTIKLDHIIDSIDVNAFPEIVEGFNQYLSVYAVSNQFSKNDFVEFMQDMYAASPDLYEESLRSLWRLN